MIDRPLRLGTRASPLALAQAHLTRDALCKAHGWDSDRVEIVAMVASGDKIQDRPLADIGGKALWTKELDIALGEGAIDFAVHSMKDVETIRPEQFAIAAMLPRADVRDRLIGAASIAALPEGATVGTSSPRRTAQLLRARPDLKIVMFRGNVATRLGKLATGEAHATLLAAAGLDRLGMTNTGVAIETAEMLPAPSQGAVGIEVLVANTAVSDLFGAIDDVTTHKCVDAERQFLATLQATCHSPVAALATISGTAIAVRGEILSEDGRLCEHGEGDDAVALAQALLDRADPALRRIFQ